MINLASSVIKKKKKILFAYDDVDDDIRNSPEEAYYLELLGTWRRQISKIFGQQSNNQDAGSTSIGNFKFKYDKVKIEPYSKVYEMTFDTKYSTVFSALEPVVCYL